MYHTIKRDTYNYTALAGLLCFQFLFCMYSLLQSPNSAYKLLDTDLFHLAVCYKEYTSPIFKMVMQHMVILMLCAGIVFLLLERLELPSVSVTVPLFSLLTIGVMLQDGMRTQVNAQKHFYSILAGLFLMMAAIFAAKSVIYLGTGKVRRVLIHILFVTLCFLSAVLLFCSFVGMISGRAVNGAYGIIQLKGLSFTPCEYIKMLLLALIGLVYVDLRMDAVLRIRFYKVAALALFSVMMSRDIGNFFILLVLVLLTCYILEKQKLILLIAAGVACVIFVGYLLHSFDLFPSLIGYMPDRFASVQTAASNPGADSTRRALLAALNGGLFGTGAEFDMFINNVYAVYTDYCFLAIQAVYGAGISCFMIFMYALLFTGCAVRYRNSTDCVVYCYSNTFISVIAVQTILHISVNLNIMPYTGVTLPFISAGMSSMLMCFICLGVVLGVYMNDEVYRRVKEAIRSRKGMRTRRGAGVAAVIICLALFVSGTGFFLIDTVGKKYDANVRTDFQDMSSTFNAGVECPEEFLNIAVFGLDTRNEGIEGNSRSDMIMVFSINRKTGDVKYTSVLRDTQVEVLKNGDTPVYVKANAAYAYGGAKGAVAMLNQNLDLTIEDYVSVNFAGVANVIDALGGIALEIDEKERKQMNQYISDMKKETQLSADLVEKTGLVHLDGTQAVAYCRNRYTAFEDKESGKKYFDDDARTARQRYVLEILVKKAIRNPIRTYLGVCRVLDLNEGENRYFESSLSFAKLKEMVWILPKLHLQGSRFPFQYKTPTINHVSMLVADDFSSNVSRLHKFLFNKEAYKPSDKVKQLDVYMKPLTD